MYQALYRTWRPARFADIVGQDAIVRTLLNQLRTGHTSHAYLFCGSRGTGKTSTAKILARALNCLDPRDGEPCGECEACRDALNATPLDVFEIDAASNNGVDEIRDLRERILYPPTIGRKRVYIIDEVHMLSTGAFNALLKTLEEPPEHAVFILATTEPQRLPATILSRCQRYDFNRIRAEVIQAHLAKVLAAQDMTAEPAALEQVALAAEGGMRDALSILDMCISYSDGHVDEATVNQVLGSSGRAFIMEFCGALLSEDAATALRMVDELMRQGRDVQVFLRDITGHLRALMLARIVGDELAQLIEVTQEDARRIRAQAESVSTERLMQIMDTFLDAERDARYIAHGRVLLEMAVTRVCSHSRVENMEQLRAELDRLEKRIESGAVAAPASRADSAASAPQKAAHKAAPARPAPAVSGSDADKYKAAMTAFRSTCLTGATLIKKGRFAGVNGDTAIIEFSEDARTFGETLKQPNMLQPLEAALSEAFGREIHCQFKVLQAAAPASGSSAALQEVYDTFGRENVQVADNLP